MTNRENGNMMSGRRLRLERKTCKFMIKKTNKNLSKMHSGLYQSYLSICEIQTPKSLLGIIIFNIKLSYVP